MDFIFLNVYNCYDIFDLSVGSKTNDVHFLFIPVNDYIDYLELLRFLNYNIPQCDHSLLFLYSSKTKSCISFFLKYNRQCQ
jgi:hypothetical protein